jgi:dTDP-4-dehydrorhamnose reductase
MRNKILLLGANGMAGHVITTGLREDAFHFDIISVARNNSIIKPDCILDITDFVKLEKLVKKTQPAIIINCIGILNRSAEENPHSAVLINSYLPHFLEYITKNSNTKVIHISTDCVFSGRDGNYTEFSLKDGLGYYAQSKALGELVNNKDLTLRTSIIGPEINPNGIGLFHWFYHQNGEIKGYTNAYWTGVTTIELLNALKFVINDNNIVGLYHLVNDIKISKYQLLEILNNEFEKQAILIPDDKYKVDKSLINTRKDFSFNIKNYDQMIKEMKLWINNHKDIYKHYDITID